MITVEAVRAGYDGQEILHGVSFTIQKGECLSIIGPNGCGKTTLLRAIAGVMPFEGEVRLAGEKIRDMPRKVFARHVAMLSQNTQMHFGYTVMEMVMMGRYAHRHTSILATQDKQDERIAREALATVGMQEFSDRSVESISGGQLQRVLLAKVIAQDPDLVLLDEPTNHLDLRHQVELVEFLNAWSKKQGKTVIGVVHDINLALRFSDKLLLLDDGYLRAQGTCAQVLGNSALNAAYEMDVTGYMLQSLAQWQHIQEGFV